MPNIATLTVTLAADSARYVAELAKADRKSKTFVGSVQKAVSVGAKAAATAATGGAAALTAVTISASRSADQLAKTSDKLGIATEKLAALQLAGRLTGVQNEKFSLGLQRMTRRIAEAAQGTGEAQGALKELGLDARELARLPLDQQFERIAQAMSGVKSQSDRVRLGFKLFDSEGVDLIRTLKLVEGGLGAVEDEARRFGVAISRVDAKKIEQANDAAERAKTAWQGIGTNIALAIAPLQEDLATAFAEAALETNGFKTEINSAFEALVRGAAFAANAIRGIQLSLLAARLAGLKVLETVTPETSGVTLRERFLRSLGPRGLGFVGAGGEAGSALAEIREEMDATAKQMAELVTAIQEGTGDQVVERFRQLSAAADQRARDSVASSSTPVVTTDTDALNETERKKLESRLQAVRESLFTETQAVAQAFVERAAVATEAFEKQLIDEEERDRILLDLAKQTADELVNIEKDKQDRINRAVLDGIATREEFEKATLKTQVKGVLGTLERITAGVATHSKGLFRLNQAAAIANAVVNTAEGVTKALSAYPPPLSFAMAAAQAAAGAVQIAAIRSAQFGGGTTPSVAGTVPTLEGQPVQQPQPIESEPRTVNEFHIHGSLLAGQDTRDSIKRWVREITDSDDIIMHPNSRNGLALRTPA